MVNISQIKLYQAILPGQKPVCPDAITVTKDRHKEYKVEKIVASRMKAGRLEYLVHWLGWDETDRT